MRLNQLSVKWKIYSIVLVSVLGFGSYLGFNLWVNYVNSQILTHVKDIYFPILEKSQKSSVLLERMNEMFLTAVQTNENSYNVEAQNTGKKISELLQAIEIAEPSRKHQVSELITQFDRYYISVSSLCSEMVSNSVETENLPTRIDSKEAFLKQFSENLNDFIQFANDRFENDIVEADGNSREALITGAVIWVAIILLVTLTALAIAKLILENINYVSASLKKIAAGSGDFNNAIKVASDDEIGRLGKSFNDLLTKLKEKTNDLSCMMGNMHQGLFTITHDEVIHPEYSDYLEEIFERKEIAGVAYDEVLFEHSDLGSSDLDQIKSVIASLLQQPEMMWDFNSHLLPGEFQWQFNSTSKIIELNWDPIIADDVIDKIMVTARDVTALRALQKESQKNREELEMVGHILAISVPKFDQFYLSSVNMLQGSLQLINSSKIDKDTLIAQLFINMHTIKGNSRTLGLNAIKDVVHEAESVCDKLRKDEHKDIDKKELLTQIERVSESLDRYNEVRSGKLNYSSRQSGSEDQVVVSVDDICELIGECRSLFNSRHNECNNEELNNKLNKLSSKICLPLPKAIEDVVQSLGQLAGDLNKPTPEVFFTGDELNLKISSQTLLQSVFSHLFRNALDHGIESPEERTAAAKSPKGKITIEVKVTKFGATVKISDDGRGLSLGKLKQKALEDNILPESMLTSAEQIADVIFASGCSTADVVTDISGRGVGMDAARALLRNQGCDLVIELSEGVSAENQYCRFAIVINLCSKLMVPYEKSQIKDNHIINLLSGDGVI